MICTCTLPEIWGNQLGRRVEVTGDWKDASPRIDVFGSELMTLNCARFVINCAARITKPRCNAPNCSPYQPISSIGITDDHNIEKLSDYDTDNLREVAFR